MPPLLYSALPGDSRRMEIYRQAFDLFIEEFKTYQNFLSDVKNEYEATIGSLLKKCEALEHYKSRLATIRFEHVQDMSQYSQDSEHTMEKFRL